MSPSREKSPRRSVDDHFGSSAWFPFSHIRLSAWGLPFPLRPVSLNSWEIPKPQGLSSYTDRGEMDAFLSRLAELCYRKGKLVPLNPEIAQRLQIPPEEEVYASTYEGDDGALHSIEEYREYDGDPEPQEIFFGVNDGKSVTDIFNKYS